MAEAGAVALATAAAFEAGMHSEGMVSAIGEAGTLQAMGAAVAVDTVPSAVVTAEAVDAAPSEVVTAEADGARSLP
jgi:hypothetical protein